VVSDSEVQFHESELWKSEMAIRTAAFGALSALFIFSALAVAAPAQGEPVATMWQVVHAPRWDVMVRSIERRSDPFVLPGGESARPSGTFAIFVVDLTNLGTEPTAPAAADFVISDSSGQRWTNLATTPAGRDYATAAGLVPFGDPVAPGATVSTIALFDIKPHAGLLVMHYLPADRSIRIDECHCNLPVPVKPVLSGSD
jgi:hypothetical protein